MFGRCAFRGGQYISLVSPRLSGAAIDAIIPGNVDFPVVLRYVLLMILCAAASALMSYLLARLMVRLSRSVVYQMRKDLFQRLGEMPVSFFDTHQTGDVISVYSYDVDTVNASLSNDLTQMLSSLITVGGSLYMMLRCRPTGIGVCRNHSPLPHLHPLSFPRVRPLYRAAAAPWGNERIRGGDGQRTENREGLRP